MSVLKYIEQRRSRNKRFVLRYAVMSCITGLMLLCSIGFISALHVESVDQTSVSDCGFYIPPTPNPRPSETISQPVGRGEIKEHAHEK